MIRKYIARRKIRQKIKNNRDHIYLLTMASDMDDALRAQLILDLLKSIRSLELELG